MNVFLPLVLFSAPVVLLAVGLLRSSMANRMVSNLRVAVPLIAAWQGLSALLVASLWVSGGGNPLDTVLFHWSSELPIGISLYVDGATILMFGLVSFVSWVICRYSVRYLDGDPNQGRYFCWVAFTIGAVSMMVISGNLLMFFGAWVLTSLGLHHLLTHFADRPAASEAAWTKFMISRLGDLALMLALVLIFSQWKTFEFVELYKAAASLGDQPLDPFSPLAVAGWCLILGAITKSAQFPFHAWLPQTMETPTPVSALMHAGIVNAGGYLMIRCSPFVSHVPMALMALTLIGAFTACFAGVIMLTQPSIKRSLAYSTIAQMGFMMLQCGLGAFSAAMLHIVAHSLYKAHAFLGSGDVIAQRAATQSTPTEKFVPPRASSRIAISLVTASGLYGLFLLLGVLNPSEKPGGHVLGLVITVALAALIWQSLGMAILRLRIAGIGIAGLLALCYGVSYLIVDQIVLASGAMATPVTSHWLVGVLVSLAFISLFGLHVLLRLESSPRWMHAWYVHASNGFYFDAMVRRIFRTAFAR